MVIIPQAKRCKRVLIFSSRAGSQHRTGVCGEIFATAMYIRKNNAPPRSVIYDSNGRRTGLKARVATCVSLPKDNKSKQGYALPACTGKWNEWGCREFMASQGIDEVDPGIYSGSGYNRQGLERAEDPDPSLVEPVETYLFGVPIKNILDATDMMEID